MPLDVLESVEVIEQLENFLIESRPPKHIQDKLDIGYKIENQSVIIHEIRPHFQNQTKILELPIAKTTYVRSQNNWKVFWRRANGNWESYPLCNVVSTIADFLKLVREDKNHCFWG